MAKGTKQIRMGKVEKLIERMQMRIESIEGNRSLTLAGTNEEEAKVFNAGMLAGYKWALEDLLKHFEDDLSVEQPPAEEQPKQSQPIEQRTKDEITVHNYEAQSESDLCDDCQEDKVAQQLTVMRDGEFVASLFLCKECAGGYIDRNEGRKPGS